MRAMMLEEYRKAETGALRLREVDTPAPGSDEVLVRVSACGVCRTDLHVIEGDLSPAGLPVIPGHQAVGTVERCGAGCSRFCPGTRVGVPWLGFACGSCEFCLSGKENICPSSKYTGYHRHGGYAEYIVAREAFCYRIPAGFSDTEAAPLLCAGIIGYRALLKSNPPARGRLGIFGFGSSAHITAQIAIHRGLELFVSSRGAVRRRLAQDLGAVWVGEGSERPPVLLDSAIVFAPAGEIVPIALQALKPGGTVSLAGIHMTQVPAMNYEESLFHEKTLCSVEANTRRDGEEFFEAAAQARVRVRTETYPLERANEALCKLKAGEISGSAVLVLGG